MALQIPLYILPMPIISIVLFMMLSLMSIGQPKTNPLDKPSPITLDDIAALNFANYCSPYNSCELMVFQLDHSAIVDFLSVLNTSSPEGYCNFPPMYTFNIEHTDGTFARYFAMGSSFVNADGMCYRANEPAYFRKLWDALISKN